MRVAKEAGAIGTANVGLDPLDTRIIEGERETVADSGPADDEHTGVIGSVQEKLAESLVVAAGNGVPADAWQVSGEKTTHLA